MLRLVVIEDHRAIAEGLALLLGASATIQVVGVAGGVEAAEALITATAPDVVLCDVMLGGRDGGFDLLARYGRSSRFLMYSAFDYPAHHVRAVREGAAGYLSKTAEPEAVFAAIRRVGAGLAAFPPDVLESVRQAPREPTPRELELLALLVAGATNEELATRLHLRVKSVEGMLRRLFDRYGLENRTQLARFAVAQGWLTGTGTIRA